MLPLRYNVRSLFVRRSATLLTVFGIAATVAVLSGVLALQQGFERLHSEHGREDIAVFRRPGSLNEGDSQFTRDRALELIKSLPEIATDATGQPLASTECFLAIRRFKVGGGETNVPMRGVQPATFELRGDELRIVEGRRFAPGTDEVVVGSKLVNRIRNCRVGEVIVVNRTPFRVVGVLDSDGPFTSEIWGDLDRMLEALNRPGPNRVIARIVPGTDLEALSERLRDDPLTPAKVESERAYLSSQTTALSEILVALGWFLGVVMGVAAVFTAINTMLAAISSRSHEIGILLATGFRPLPIFASFLLESLVLGLLGGLVGCLLTLPINGIETGTTNFQTFTEVAFAFRVTPGILLQAIVFALVLGLLGGAWPAWRAARLSPTEALRRR